MNQKFYRLLLGTVLFTGIAGLGQEAFAQLGRGTQWAKDGYQYYRTVNGEIAELDSRDQAKKTVLATQAMLTPAGSQQPLQVRRFALSDDGQKVLINTNTRKVWRYDSRGDYWVIDLKAKTLKQLGKGRPASSLMFAKFSPDGRKVAYVYEHNIYAEDVSTGAVKQLTADGTQKLINGTFDWAYEEEFDCRDGFRWAPDGHAIAYWQINATKIPNYLMLNTTKATYPVVEPVEYPVAGEDPSLCRIGVVSAEGGATRWMQVPGDAVQHYIPRMQWANNSNELILEQLNRAQNEAKVFMCNVSNGTARIIHQENDKAWVDVRDESGWQWVDQNRRFIWLSEKDGWKHVYSIDREGHEKLLTPGKYDVISLSLVDEANGLIYFMASPENATQRYLYRTKLTGGKAERISPADQPGTHGYELSPNGKIALHNFSNSYTRPLSEIISLPEHQHLSGNTVAVDASAEKKVEFFKVTTTDGIELDGWMVKPSNFDPAKKYPIVFNVYGEPASQTVTDTYGIGMNRLYNGSMADDGYIYASLENRGAPAPKGREWRKSIYRNIGILNIRDQAMGTKAMIQKYAFIDTSRIAVHGWSGGGSSTLNLMFQYPEIYKTGISVAAVGWQLSYDNIYQERYMGVPTTDEGRSYFIKGSPVTYAKNLRGNLLYIHGTGDDNVHYQNAELLINELVKYNKQFQLMSYPNRTHSISEGEGTGAHLRGLFTQYLKEHCAPGGR